MLTIRELTPHDDFVAVGTIYAESWKFCYRGLVPQAYLDKLTHDRWSSTLHAEPAASLGMFLGDKIIGTARVCFAREPEREGYGEIVSIYLLPAYMGQGYGRALMNAAIEKLKRDGCDDICLWVLQNNTVARGFYEHMGFVCTGRTQTEGIGGAELFLTEFCLHIN